MSNTNKLHRWRLPAPWRPAAPLFAFHEDSNANAALITPGGEIFAVAEERLTRKRFQGGFPGQALAWIEEASGCSMDQASTLVFGNRTHFLPRVLGPLFPSFEHDFFGAPHKLMLCFQHLCYLSGTFSSTLEGLNRLLLGRRFGKDIAIVDHHLAHAASAYYCSGRTGACAVTVDNYGDGYAAKVFDCQGAEIAFLRGVSALHSPGQFYGEMAQLAGIAPMLAGKLTGMAATGDPSAAAAEVRQIFGEVPGARSFPRTIGLLRSPGRAPFSRLARLERNDLAASVQRQFEETVLSYVKAAVQETGRCHVVLAGGCFANVRLNQRVLELPEVDTVYIHPAMTDQGIALGAALAYLGAQQRPLPFRFENILLGPEPSEEDMLAALERHGLGYTCPEDMARRAAELLVQGKIIARFAGPMEYGLRALGNRSILYQTQDPNLQQQLNQKLHRAPYMPFAPMTMEPHAAQCYQDVDKALEAARFMTIAFHATDWMKEHCPGVVHVDGTVRPQVLRATDNPQMYNILEQYHRLTGVPSVLNTSFNMHEEPIVASAEDGCRAFIKADLDYLILGPFLARQ